MRWVIGLAFLGVCGVACGQSEPVLQGPRVEVKRIPGVEEGFGGEPGLMQRMASRPVPLQVMQRAIASLSGDEVVAELRLTEEQAVAIRRLTAEFRESVSSYLRAHPGEASEMRRALRSLREGLGGDVDRQVREGERRDRVPGDRAKEAKEDVGAAAAASERMEMIRGGMPDLLGLQTRIWNELTDGQRAYLSGVLEAWREEEASRWREAYVQRQLAARGQGAEASAGRPPAEAQRIMERLPVEMRERLAGMSEADRAAAMERIMERLGGMEGKEADRLIDRLPEGLRARLMELSEEERSAVLERIRRRLEGGGPGRDRGGAARIRDKPPPPISEVRVPAPDGGR